MPEVSDLDVFTLKELSTPRGPRGRVYRLMRKAGEEWFPVGTYGSFDDAGEAIDQAVGRGEGAATDYRIDELRVSQPTWKKILRRVALAALVILCVATVVFLIWVFLAPGSSPVQVPFW